MTITKFSYIISIASKNKYFQLSYLRYPFYLANIY
nr:MAG TPA: hypothetical protein [Caudoviricetes sp.]